MAAMVQTYPQQTTITMLQTRPTANAGMMPPSQPQPSHTYAGNPSQVPRSPYHGAGSPTGYRGSTGPVQPYAFTSTPNLNQTMQWPQYAAYRTNSSPAAPMSQPYDPYMNYRGRLQPNQAVGYPVYNQSMGFGQTGSRDDSAIAAPRNVMPVPRPQSAYLSGSPQSLGQTAPGKTAPERYRRQTAQSAQHGRSQSSTLPANQLNNGLSDAASPLVNRPNSFYGTVPGSKDDLYVQQHVSQEDLKRSRRRSVHNMDAGEASKHSLQSAPQLTDSISYANIAAKPAEKDQRSIRAHSRNGSSESIVSSRSSHSRPSSATNRSVSIPTGNPSLLLGEEQAAKQDQPKLVNIPPRGSSTDARRALNPSPLSKPATMAGDAGEDTAGQNSTMRPMSPAAGANLDSPAAKQLAAINQSGGKAKSKTSRLRRAFSFGSAAELRKAAGGEIETSDKAEPAKLHKDPTPEEAYNAEQARIAEAQEAGGIGNSIYGSRLFGGSTDNLSISSTASSASIMIRKMGRGMKKGSRSLAGLFRPKSIVGVAPPEPLAPEASQAAVSMITVEAETQRVNVSPDPQGTTGGTGFPRLERNSIDTSLPDLIDMIPERLGSSGTDKSQTPPRKSIVGGDKERAEVLAAVRKGILKRSSSPSVHQTTDHSGELEPPSVPTINDSPNSSAPSTPNDEAQGHRRTGSIAIGSEDYFVAALRLRQDTKSAPATPHGTVKRNATFSPRIIFHDTWPPQEYDRRGDVATCNRLTPMLAQQIKEELNTFKMEMEVHENSKIYTHFF